MDYQPTEIHSPTIFIGVYKNLENFVISHVWCMNDKVFNIFIDAYKQS